MLATIQCVHIPVLAWRFVLLSADACPYLSSKQHVVDQLHVRLHLGSLYVVQAVAQRVTLKKQNKNKTKHFLDLSISGLLTGVAFWEDTNGS